MPIVFSAIVPHPPVLIPEIGKDHAKDLAITHDALKKIEQELYAAKPDCLVLISPHGTVMPESFSINLSPEYVAHFKEFGDYGIELKHHGDYMSIQAIRAADESNKEAPIVLTSTQELDHGFGVTLFTLAQHIKDVPIIPITPSGLDLEKHFEFGQFLHRQLSKIDKRFAVIASGDLSNKLSKDAPAGFSDLAERFDTELVEGLKKHDQHAVMSIDKKVIAEAGGCGLRPIVMLLGLLKEMEVTPTVLSYEKPFGVGYVVVNYQFR